MTVVSNPNDPFKMMADNCTGCGCKIDHISCYPIIQWGDREIITLCRCCIARMVPGFIADLVEAKAIMDLQDVDPRYRTVTLVRTWHKDLERQWKGERTLAEIMHNAQVQKE